MAEQIISAYYNMRIMDYGNPRILNNVISIPITIAAEISQPYHYSELPKQLISLKSKVLYKILKTANALKNAISKIDSLPLVKDHVGRINPSHDVRIIGYAKDLYFDESSKPKKIKGTAYITRSKLTDEEYNKLINRVVDVSVDGTATYGNGCTFNGEEIDYTQNDLSIDYVAVLFNDKGRCPSNICGLNQDTSAKIDDITDISQFNQPMSIQDKMITFTLADSQIKNDPQKTEPLEIPIKEDESITDQINMTDIEKLIAQISDQQVKINDSDSKLKDAIKDAQTQKEMFIKQIEDKDTEIASISKERDELKLKFEDQEKSAIVQRIVDSGLFTDAEEYTADNLNKKCVKELRVMDSTVKTLMALKNKSGFPKITDNKPNPDKAKKWNLNPTTEANKK